MDIKGIDLDIEQYIELIRKNWFIILIFFGVCVSVAIVFIFKNVITKVS